MAQLKRLSDGALFPMSVYPVWANGVWGTGDETYNDAGKSLYAPVGDAPATQAAISQASNRAAIANAAISLAKSGDSAGALVHIAQLLKE